MSDPAALGSALDAVLCYACLATVAGLAAAALLRGGLRASEAARDPWILALTALALAVRALAPPAIVHAGFHGYALLDSIAAWPALAVYRPGYGHASYIVLGVAGRLLGFLGDPLRATALANAVVGAATLVAASSLARRAAGPLAARATLAAGLLLPVLVRTAASEDAHGVACFFGMVALVAADAARREGALPARRGALLVAAGLLAFYGRQSMFFWPPLLALVAGWGRFGALLARPSTWALGAALLVATVPKVLVLLYGHEESYGLMLMLTVPMLSPRLLQHHPLLQPGESGALLVALAAGVPALARGGGSPLGVARDPTLGLLAAAAAFAFVTSLAMSAEPGPGLVYGFRLPLFVLLLPLAGAGAARGLEALTAWARRGAAAPATGALPALGLGLLACAPGPALLRVLREPSPLAAEFETIARAARAAGLAGSVRALLGPSGELKVPHAAFGPGAPVTDVAGGPDDVMRELAAHPPRYVYQGLGCACFPIKELVDPAGPPFNARAAAMDLAQMRGFLAALWDDPADAIHRLGGEPREGQSRPECAIGALVPGARFEPWGEIEVGPQTPLDRYFTRPRVPVGLWELPGPSEPPRDARGPR